MLFFYDNMGWDVIRFSTKEMYNVVDNFHLNFNTNFNNYFSFENFTPFHCNLYVCLLLLTMVNFREKAYENWGCNFNFWIFLMRLCDENTSKMLKQSPSAKTQIMWKSLIQQISDFADTKIKKINVGEFIANVYELCTSLCYMYLQTVNRTLWHAQS